jgi:uncharacterized membrane protein YebE (DUF533 family)
MKPMKSLFLGSALAVSALGAGCVGTGPNTQQGAVTGGALGALAGAIIGNNSGGSGLGGALIGGAVGAIAGGTLGNQEDNQRGTVYDGRAYAERPPVYRRYESGPPPPPPAPPSDPVTAPPSPNAVWVPGYWTYDGYRYTWVGGRWELPGRT